MHQMDLEYEHGCINNTAIWKRGVKVYSPGARRSICVRLVPVWLSDGELRCHSGSGHWASATHTSCSSYLSGGWGHRETTERESPVPRSASCIWKERNQRQINAQSKKKKWDGIADFTGWSHGGNVKNPWNTGDVNVCLHTCAGHFCVCVCAHVQWLWWWRWGLPPCVGLGAESRWARDGAENLYWLFLCLRAV